MLKMKQIVKYIIVVAAVMMPLCGFSADFKAQLDSAAASYQATKYEQAISIYENIVAQGYESAELYFNLGNAYYKSNKLPYAIANYERALKLNATDEDIQFNLHRLPDREDFAGHLRGFRRIHHVLPRQKVG